MQAEIYADIVFFINFIMDAFIFWITSKLIKRKTKAWRIMAGAFCAAALYCALIFISGLRPLYNFFSCLLILALSLFITFLPRKAADFIKLLLFSHIAAFSVGGLGMALFAYTNLTGLIGNYIKTPEGSFPVRILIASACISYTVINLTIGWIRRVMIKKQTFYNIKIHFGDDSLTVNALMDTGNSLTEPIGHLPVIVTEFDAVKGILPDGLRLMFYEKKENNYEYISEILENDDFKYRIRMIPYQSVGRENGMLIGFKPDMVEVFEENKIISVKNVIIGIYNFKLSADGSYQGLLNPEIII